MNINEKIEIIKKNTEEIITEEDLRKVIEKKKNPVVYCGYELSGDMHLGHFVTITKLIDMRNVGFKVKILLADLHTLLNLKDKDLNKEIESWKKTIKAIGLKCEIVLGSSFQHSKEYQLDVIKLAQNTTINRGLRSMQEIARDIENATVSQVIYPLMQITDIKYLDADVALGGLEQRKIHVMGREMSKILGHDFVALHTPLITSLKGPGQKMSKSIQGSGISVLDSHDEIKKTLRGAYCPEKKVEDNPVLQICKLILFSHFKKIELKRNEKFGGDVVYENYHELEKDYKNGKIHPLDLKNAVADSLEKLIKPIREKWKG